MKCAAYPCAARHVSQPTPLTVTSRSPKSHEPAWPGTCLCIPARGQTARIIGSICSTTRQKGPTAALDGSPEPDIRVSSVTPVQRFFALAKNPSNTNSFEKLERFWLGTLCGLGPRDHLYMRQIKSLTLYPQHLLRLQKRCNFFSAFQGLRFCELSKELKELHVYTDFMEVAIKRPIQTDKISHHLSMHVAISVLRHERHLFLLGVTPGFNPTNNAQSEAVRTAIRDAIRSSDLCLEANLPHAHLRDLLPWSQGTKHRGHVQLNPMGLGGSRILRVYTALGHFYMLRMLLRPVSRVYHYIDQADDLRIGALSAFAQAIREDCCDVIFVSREKGQSRHLPGQRSEQIVRGVKQHRKARSKQICKKHHRKGQVLWKEDDTAPAIVHRRAYSKQRKPEHESFWVRALAPGEQSGVLRTFWASYREVEKVRERDIHLRASMNPVDSCIDAIRTRLYGAARPVSTATGHRGYRGQPELPVHTLAALDLFRCRWNYCDPVDRIKITRAQHFGLANKIHASKDVLQDFKVPDKLIPQKKTRAGKPAS